MMTGMPAVRGVAFRRLQTSMPLRSGSIRSSSTSAGVEAVARARASVPFAAVMVA